MRSVYLFATLIAVPAVAAETSGSKTWNELEAKRNALGTIHQEFDVTQTWKGDHGTQSIKSQLMVDMAGQQWRERSISGSGDQIRLFDGDDLLSMEEGGDEYVRVKRNPKEGVPAPGPYSVDDAELPKAVEVERRPCGVPNIPHECVVLDLPLKKWVRSRSATDMSRLLGGSRRMLIDTVTGLVIVSRVMEVVQTRRGGYQSDKLYALHRFTSGAPADANLFKLPSESMREVKELSPWNAARMKRQLAGKPAPEFAVRDLAGNPVTLSELKGKTVLVDFWATWCGPCRADAPSLDKLYKKYGNNDLMIVGISVSEDRAIVEKYLADHPHAFPIVLSTENTLPRAYQVRVFPTYIVIDADGVLTAAAEGDQGFSELRKLLKKAGLDAE